MKRENLKPQFPKAWLWFADDFLPGWVKRNFSPQESWKKKPFQVEDAKFFLRGIRELSDIFTEDRSKKIHDYFNHTRFRSSYFLYFVPLQAGKFCTLFSRHEDAIRCALKSANARGEMTLVDLGAGPGTASLSLLLTLLQLGEKLPEKIRIHWVDQNDAVLKDGKKLMDEVIDHFAEFRGRVEVILHVTSWKSWARKWDSPLQLLLVGNVLNESNGTAQDFFPLMRSLEGGGALFVEPASRPASQGLSKLRNDFFEEGVLPSDGTSLWGPCLHSGLCPLTDGRDWCHFSVFLKTPGKWFEFFSRGLGSAREWQKYSYLWLASKEHPAPAPEKDLRRVISDPLAKPNDGKTKQVLLCAPERPGRLDLKGRLELWRGDLYDLKKGFAVGTVTPTPVTKPSSPRPMAKIQKKGQKPVQRAAQKKKR